MSGWDAEQAARANADAWNSHVAALEAVGQVGPESFVRCSLAPGTDKVHVRRYGPADLHTSRVLLRASDSNDQVSVHLTARDARRLAMALLDAADEIDDTEPLRFALEEED